MSAAETRPVSYASRPDFTSMLTPSEAEKKFTGALHLFFVAVSKVSWDQVVLSYVSSRQNWRWGFIGATTEMANYHANAPLEVDEVTYAYNMLKSFALGAAWGTVGRIFYSAASVWRGWGEIKAWLELREALATQETELDTEQLFSCYHKFLQLVNSGALPDSALPHALKQVMGQVRLAGQALVEESKLKEREAEVDAFQSRDRSVPVPLQKKEAQLDLESYAETLVRGVIKDSIKDLVENQMQTKVQLICSRAEQDLASLLELDTQTFLKDLLTPGAAQERYLVPVISKVLDLLDQVKLELDEVKQAQNQAVKTFIDALFKSLSPAYKAQVNSARAVTSIRTRRDLQMERFKRERDARATVAQMLAASQGVVGEVVESDSAQAAVACDVRAYTEADLAELLVHTQKLKSELSAQSLVSCQSLLEILPIRLARLVVLPVSYSESYQSLQVQALTATNELLDAVRAHFSQLELAAFNEQFKSRSGAQAAASVHIDDGAGAAAKDDQTLGGCFGGTTHLDPAKVAKQARGGQGQQQSVADMIEEAQCPIYSERALKALEIEYEQRLKPMRDQPAQHEYLKARLKEILEKLEMMPGPEELAQESESLQSLRWSLLGKISHFLAVVYNQGDDSNVAEAFCYVSQALDAKTANLNLAKQSLKQAQAAVEQAQKICATSDKLKSTLMARMIAVIQDPTKREAFLAQLDRTGQKETADQLRAQYSTPMFQQAMNAPGLMDVFTRMAQADPNFVDQMAALGEQILKGGPGFSG